MENLDFTQKKRTDADFVPGFGATPKEEVEEIARIERVGNIEVDQYFDIERLNNLKQSVIQNKDLFKGDELKKYEDFISTIEKILTAREALKKLQEEEQRKKNLH